jgi:hypothetical protein
MRAVPAELRRGEAASEEVYRIGRQVESASHQCRLHSSALFDSSYFPYASYHLLKLGYVTSH